MEWVLQRLQPSFAEAGYLIVFLATFLENAAFVGAVIPGDIVLLLGGVYALRGALELPQVMVLAFAGGLSGDIVGYLLGRFGGRWVVERFGHRFFLPKDRLARVERYFKAKGSWAVFLGRFAPVLRTLRTFVAGMSRMPFGRFVAADIAGAAIWAVAVPSLGWAFAGSLHLARRTLGAGGFVLLLVLLVAFAVTYRTMARDIKEEL